MNLEEQAELDRIEVTHNFASTKDDRIVSSNDCK